MAYCKHFRADASKEFPDRIIALLEAGFQLVRGDALLAEQRRLYEIAVHIAHVYILSLRESGDQGLVSSPALQPPAQRARQLRERGQYHAQHHQQKRGQVAQIVRVVAVLEGPVILFDILLDGLGYPVGEQGLQGLRKKGGGAVAAQPEYIIEMQGITKRFPGIVANDNITLQLRKGEIHALLGENGAGKSTLMSVLFGMYHTFAGVWQKSEVSTAALYGAKPGDAKYVDINRDGKIDKDDIGIIGNAQPKLSFGFNNTFTIFDFDLNIFWQGVSGNDIYNQNRIRRETYSSDAFPTSTVMKNHWTPENPTNIPAFSGAEYVNSSRWVEKGDYLRLKNITLPPLYPVDGSIMRYGWSLSPLISTNIGTSSLDGFL